MVKKYTIYNPKFLSKNIISLLLVIIVLVLLYIVYKYLFKNMIEPFTNPTIKGYYIMSWINSPAPPGKWDFGIYFGGESPKESIDKYINMSSKITSGKKILNLGGGLDTGIWKGQSDFNYINSKLFDIKKAGWDGLCFDIEVCTPNVDLVEMFSNCFSNCKATGLLVIVTISHSMPYSCQTGKGQGKDLINEWLTDKNIDYISPQLYSSGTILETSDLSVFKEIQNKILPSIPYDSDWEKLNTTNIGINPTGYILWNSAPPTPKRNYCGTDWSTANSKCGTQCPGRQDSECPSGQKCFADLNNCPINK